jgi:UDPglucose--hexose-1-phosphate uridylyltransferase
MSHGQIRQNKITKELVIYAPTRSERPRDYVNWDRNPKRPPSFDKECPFCPGNDDMLPGILEQVSMPRGDEWQTRVVPNKYPALTPDSRLESTKKDFYLTMPAQGAHEVIIESPRHDRDLADMSVDRVAVVISTYQKRYKTLMADTTNSHVILFRNHGVRAGTSLEHPHSQVITTGIKPPYVERREKVAREYYEKWNRCLYCDLLSHEMQDRHRLICVDPYFLTFVPFAAEVPFEIWIMPRVHQADFEELTQLEVTEFSVALKKALLCLRRALGDPDYNYVINTPGRSHRESASMHWFLQIKPRITTPAGFEIGSGMHVNPSLPEADAACLRGESENPNLEIEERMSEDDKGKSP